MRTFLIFFCYAFLSGCAETTNTMPDYEDIDTQATLERNLNPKYINKHSTEFCPNSGAWYVGGGSALLAGAMMPAAALLGVIAGTVMYTANRERYDTYCVVDKKFVDEEGNVDIPRGLYYPEDNDNEQE